MAMLRPGRSSRRRLSLKGGAVLRVQNGRTYAQAWPRKRGKPRQKYQQAGLRRMTVSQRMNRYVPAEEYETMNQGLQQFLKRHTGVRGTAAIRLRDWMTQVIYGRAWRLELPNGRVLWPAAAQRDVSDILDWIDPRPGSLMTRTADSWLPTVNCKVGSVLTMTDSRAAPACCPAAHVPPADETVGGYPPEAASPSVLPPPPQPTPQPEPDMPDDNFDRPAFADYSVHGDDANLWMIRSQVLHATGPGRGFLTRDGFSAADLWVEADVSQAQDAGILARWQDIDNFYMLVLRDDSSAAPSANMQLYKRVGGAFTSLASADLSWSRGTTRTFRLTLSADTLTASVDGVDQFTVTDTAISADGLIGLRHNNSFTPSKFHRFAWS